MTEYCLIEIAARFRKLEEAIETADAFHAQRMEVIGRRLDNIEDRYKRDKAAGVKSAYERFAAEFGEAEKQKDAIEECRADIERAFETTREDLNTLVAEIRKGLS